MVGCEILHLAIIGTTERKRDKERERERWRDISCRGGKCNCFPSTSSAEDLSGHLLCNNTSVCVCVCVCVCVHI